MKMLTNYGSTITTSETSISSSPATPRNPICSKTPRRHLVMPSLRSLVSPSTGTNSSSRSQQQRTTMGASTSQQSSPQETIETCSGRLVAPRLPLSPKRAMKRDASCGSLLLGLRPSLSSRASSSAIRKCETVLALSSMEPLKPVNRLRSAGSQSKMCSRCSSVMSMQQTASRVSLDTVLEVAKPQAVLCKLCLCEVPVRDTITIIQCGCCFCTECMRQYVGLEVTEAAYEISCPDALCENQGVLSLQEVESLVTPELMEKHRKFRLHAEIDQDAERVWCPTAGCETACRVCQGCQPHEIKCPTCDETFCSECKLAWHPEKPCSQKPGDDLICDPEKVKRCPVCRVPIEKDEGCAQMMCKRCKHVFCWYCLASLDDDFLLRHYDKGPCKNKLGHSRASVIWHRTQVIAIFAGFGVLLLVASPLLLLAAPCIVCCKCRACQDAPPSADSENKPAVERSRSSSP